MVGIGAAITSGIATVVGGVVSTVSTMIADETVVYLVGFGIAFGIAKFGIGLLPFVGKR